jgi:chemotaxis signal transduction protein
VSTNETRIEAESMGATAATLRRHFDEAFAAPAASMAEALEHLLAIRVGSDPFALRLSEIAGLYVGVKVVPVPSPVSQLLGIVGIRGMMVPIYDMAALLRYPLEANSRWFVLARAPHPVGFAFDTFESHLQVSQASLAGSNGEGPGTGGTVQHMRGTVRAAGALRPIIHLASMLEIIRGSHS